MTGHTHTVVIHPLDSSTLFLENCYATAENTTVIRGPIGAEALQHALDRKDQRIVLLGHGIPHGLLNVYGFMPDNRDWIAVGDHHAEMLRQNDENIMIFCHAHIFGNRMGIPGFRTDMFVSEVAEAWACGLGRVTQEEVDFSNQLFASLVGAQFNASAAQIHRHVVAGYGKFADKSKVIRYNHERLHFAPKWEPVQ